MSQAGGTASKSSKTCKVTLPNTWLERMGVTEADRSLKFGTTLYADFSDHTIAVKNFVKDPVKTAFDTCSVPT